MSPKKRSKKQKTAPKEDPAFDTVTEDGYGSGRDYADFRFKVGDAVECLMDAGDHFYPATVVKVTDAGLDVVYDDGSREFGVAERLVKAAIKWVGVEALIKRPDVAELLSRPVPERRPAAGPYTARRVRCGVCAACTAAECGECGPCKDRPKNGGPGLMKAVCIKRRCANMVLRAPGEYSGRPRECPNEESVLDQLGRYVQMCGGDVSWVEGWDVRSEVRRGGATEGTWDTYFFDPRGKKFRSRAEVRLRGVLNSAFFFGNPSFRPQVARHLNLKPISTKRGLPPAKPAAAPKPAPAPAAS